jgi:hypothetical protein
MNYFKISHFREKERLSLTISYPPESFFDLPGKLTFFVFLLTMTSRHHTLSGGRQRAPQAVRGR